MVSILEQYEIDAGRSNEVNNFSDQLHTAFTQTSLNPSETVQIFDKQYFKLEFKSPIRQVEKCNDTILVLFDQKKINRIKENQINEIIEAPDRVSSIFLDPTGAHLLVATENLELYYFLKSTKKFKQISKLKGFLVTSVGWNSNSTEATTDSILIGTKKGLLFEICINIGDESRIFNQTIDNLCKQVYDFGEDVTIHGIQIFQKSVDYHYNEVFDILVATTKRLFEFTGSLAGKVSNETALQQPFKFAHILSLFQKQHEKLANFTEMAVGSLTYSRLVTTISSQSKIPKIAWMTGGGCLVADIDYKVLAKFNNPNINSVSINDVKCLINEQTRNIIVYPQEKTKKSSSYMDNNEPIPISVALTEYHVLIMFEKSIKIICLLSGDLIFNEKIDIANNKLISFWQNPTIYEIGYHTDKSIVKYKITKETRNLWRFYLNKDDFEMAKKYCQDNIILLNEVTVRQAENLFDNKKYIESAEIYATTDTSFEEISLKFLDAQDMTALRTFLTKKFQNLRSPIEITQITLIVSWIIEIFLNQLEELTEQKHFDAFSLLHKEFHRFLDNNKIKECLYESKEAIYEIFSGHGNMDDLIHFAEIMKDYEKIIGYYIQYENYVKALQALGKQTKPEFYYKYSPILMQHVAKQLIDMWIQLGSKLDANKLLPSLIIGRENFDQANEAIRYLEFCVDKDSKEIAIHNYLISLYVKYKPDELLNYIKRQGEDETLINYDKYYALRLCLNNCENNSIKESCVYIYKIIGLFEEAVDLALSIDVQLAKEIADSTELNINDELKQKLWLRIARHIIEDEKDVSKAMKFLDECGEIVQIEDILPYFPDFVTIDDFKDAIKDSLASYTCRIDTLKEDIETAATSAESIRNEIHQIRSKSISINSSERCLICHYPLLTRSFYVFPCAHKFHSDCLYHAITPYLLPSKRKMIDELQKALHEVIAMNFSTQQQKQSSNPVTSAASIVGTVADALNTKLFSKTKHQHGHNSQHVTATSTYSAQEIENLKSELDDLLASECIYCGDNLIKTVDEPFFNLNEYDEIFKSWL